VVERSQGLEQEARGSANGVSRIKVFQDILTTTTEREELQKVNTRVLMCCNAKSNVK